MKTTTFWLVSFCALSLFVAKTAFATSDVLGWKFKYDDSERITKVIDPAGRVSRMQYSFDKARRLRKLVRTADDGSRVTHDFDEQGRRTIMKDRTATVSYGYDNLGRLNRVQRKDSPAITYSHDTLDRIKTIQVGDFFHIEYTYDFLGRLESMKTPAGVIRYDYQTGQGTVIRTLPNGVKTFSDYEPNGELQKITHGLVSNPDDDSYQVLAEYSYQYRPDGLIEAIQERSAAGEFVRAYEYDTVGRLVRATGQQGQQQTYEYDLVGNRIKALSSAKPPQNLTYDWAGRVTSFNGTPARNDAAGNLTALSVGETTLKFRYNQENQLAEALNGKVTYRYDGEGQLIARNTGSAETTFIPNPLSDYWQPLVMKDNTGHRTLVVWDGATPLLMIRDGKAEYLLHDHLGSVRLMVDSQGNMSQRFDYESFGVMKDSAMAEDFAPRFAGLFWDPVAGVYLTRARAYDPITARFLQPDPQFRVPDASKQNHSLYTYCGDDPVNFLDLNGAEAVPFNAHSVWWNAYWKDVRRYLFDSRRAKDTLADYSDAHLRGARGSGTAAGLTATALDIVGGYIPGEGGNKGQALGSVGWSLALGGFSSFGNVTKALNTVNLTRTTSSTIINTAQGNYKNALLDLVSLGGSALGSNADKLMSGAHSIPSGQLKFNFVNKALTNTANRLKLESDLIGVFGYYSSAYDAYKAETKGGGTSSFSVHSPSPVGGVYLGGSGQSLEAVGQIEGILLDSNNNLILLSKAGKKIDLPPLRIDDVVTVFRSVYLHGEGPTVTIDPNPEDPEGSAMIVRHSKATENTYVGWVLFQADRLMKGYTLGVDNDTTKKVKSAVAGYADVLDTIYFGGESPEKLRKNGHWERFWIVPAEVRRFGTKKTELTLFDVPLKVKTQSMKWKNGELVDDLQGKSSLGATALKNWFTGKYDHIAEEKYLTPPPESGINKPVPVFTELRRIALITAIAEKLRNQGVPLPFWMRDYEIQPVPFEKFTPCLEVTRSKQRVTARVYGGVQLSPADKDVRDFTPGSNLSKLPKKEQRSVRKKIKLVPALEKAIQDEMISVEPLKVRQFKHKAAGYQAVALPGGDTQALAPGRLVEADLSVTVEDGHSIQLARHFNSFFNPNSLWGKGWTMDLPHLEKINVPVRREGNKVSYRIVYELITPLNSTYARFAHIKKVPMLNNSRLLVSDRPSDFFGLADDQPEFLSKPTLKLIRKDGGAWHFSKAGHLVAIEKGGFRTVYERNKSGRLTRIVGLLGKRPVAFIDLNYDESERVKSAKAKKAGRESTETVLHYEYDTIGRLSSIVSETGRLGYQYQGSWVTAVTYQTTDPKEVTIRSFEYNPRGQLLIETAADGAKTTYKVISDATGSTITTMQSGAASDANSIRYDPGFRPIEANYVDGTQASWNYPDTGGSVLDIKEPEGDTIRLTESADQRRRTLELDKKHKITSEFDAAGRMTSLSENGRTLVEQKWSPLGQLQVAKNETLAKHFEYDSDSLLSRIIQTPPDESGQFKHWQATKVNPAGQPVEITDYRGMHTTLGYDIDGKLEEIANRRDGKNYGFKVDRDKSGRIQEVQSSWGKQQYTYDATGRIETLKVDKKGVGASVEWKSGLLRKVRQFDGGNLSLAYYKDKKRSGLLKKITTPNELALTYQYDKANQLHEVAVGNTSRLLLSYNPKGNLTGWLYRAD